MDGGVVGRRYAKALLSLASKDNKIEDIGTELQMIADIYQNSDELKQVIADPKINRGKKTDVLDQITRKLESSDLINKYCRYLAHRNRFDIITDIASAYEALASEKLGKATANIVVATGITKKEEKSLQKQLSDYTGKKISLSVEVDESILGGAITSIGSLVLDGSVKNKLNLIRETISKGN